MKISQETNEFKPITIVLETRKEVEELTKVLGESVGGHTPYDLYCKLYDILEKPNES